MVMNMYMSYTLSVTAVKLPEDIFSHTILWTGQNYGQFWVKSNTGNVLCMTFKSLHTSFVLEYNQQPIKKRNLYSKI